MFDPFRLICIRIRLEQTASKLNMINIVGNSGNVEVGCGVVVDDLGGVGEGVGDIVGLRVVEGVGEDVVVGVSVGFTVVGGGEGAGVRVDIGVGEGIGEGFPKR